MGITSRLALFANSLLLSNMCVAQSVSMRYVNCFSIPRAHRLEALVSLEQLIVLEEWSDCNYSPATEDHLRRLTDSITLVVTCHKIQVSPGNYAKEPSGRSKFSHGSCTPHLCQGPLRGPPTLTTVALQ